jgi:hypothetical protein
MEFTYTFEGKAKYEDGETASTSVSVYCGPSWDEPAKAFVRFLRGSGFYLHGDSEERILEALAPNKNVEFGD